MSKEVFDAFSNARSRGIANEEFDFILSFIREAPDITSFSVSQAFNGVGFETKFGDTPFVEQLRSLWTAYCLHNGLTPDTADYDNGFYVIADAIREAFSEQFGGDPLSTEKEDEDDNSIADEFDLFMGEHLS